MKSKWLFKYEKSPKEIIRQDVKKLSKHILTIPYDGNEYKIYELSSIYDTPSKRYQICNQFIEDARLNIEKEELGHYLKELQDLLTKAAKDDVNAFTDALVLVKWLRAKTKISMDVDLVMRVISCCTYLEGEDPLDYDYDVNDFKIKLFEETGVTAFFLNEPIKKYLKLISTSTIDMEAILEQRNAKRAALKELKEMGISVWNTYKEERN